MNSKYYFGQHPSKRYCGDQSEIFAQIAHTWVLIRPYKHSDVYASVLLTLCCHSEKKIDRIEQRLSGIEDILERLATKLDSMDNPADHIGPRTQAKNTNVRKSPRPAGEMTPPSPAPFEGETALNAQSEYAREFIEKAVHSTPSIVQNKEVQAALASLKSMVNRHNIYGATKSELQPLFDKVTADVDASTLERPPWEAINDVIEKATRKSYTSVDQAQH
jgi:hypothetical protein